jgi:hypothetical protein
VCLCTCDVVFIQFFLQEAQGNTNKQTNCRENKSKKRQNRVASPPLHRGRLSPRHTYALFFFVVAVAVPFPWWCVGWVVAACGATCDSFRAGGLPFPSLSFRVPALPSLLCLFLAVTAPRITHTHTQKSPHREPVSALPRAAQATPLTRSSTALAYFSAHDFTGLHCSSSHANTNTHAHTRAGSSPPAYRYSICCSTAA